MSGLGSDKKKIRDTLLCAEPGSHAPAAPADLRAAAGIVARGVPEPVHKYWRCSNCSLSNKERTNAFLKKLKSGLCPKNAQHSSPQQKRHPLKSS